ncbi:MAG TPA: hypothetical protein VND45_16705 [Thermoanaerobaculia bacterium]|nr:hypothetical protein [Thermoanaerobaculia bacterium]
MIVYINGAFGIGKTTVARELVRRLPRAVLYDPEPLGIALQRITRVDDFQHLASWRRLTKLAIRVASLVAKHVVVPMAFSNPAYLREVVTRDARHFCLVAQYEVVHARLRGSGADAGQWEERRARECCNVHARPEFAEQISAEGGPAEIVEEILLRLRAAP